MQKIGSTESHAITDAFSLLHFVIDVSSGDTNSYQDDQSSLHGESLTRKNMNYALTVDFDRQLHMMAAKRGLVKLTRRINIRTQDTRLLKIQPIHVPLL